MLSKRFMLGIAVLGCSASGAMSQDQNASLQERRLEGLIESLDDASWAVREQSTLMLGDPNEGFELYMLAEELERGDLSPESRTRLRIAARSLFNQMTKAGLGIGFGGVRDGGVEIGTVVADVDRFPAAGILIPGDLIVGAEGKSLTTSDELRANILSHEPGETLNLLVLRETDVLDLDLPLGSYKLLTGAAPISPLIADRAIEIRWKRRGISMPVNRAAGGEISSEDWVEAGYPEEPGTFRASNARRSPRVVNSGSGRDIFVGIGMMVRGRIEPWSNRTNAMNSMNEARRIELSQQMNVAKIQLRMMEGNVDSMNEQTKRDPDDGTITSKLAQAIQHLRTTQRKLEALTTEFQSLNSTP